MKLVISCEGFVMDFRTPVAKHADITGGISVIVRGYTKAF